MLRRLTAHSFSERCFQAAHFWRTGKVAVHAFFARRKVSRTAKGLFIDCGSNVGQGLTYFSRFYTPDLYDYVLVEPNPHCLPKLKKVAKARVGGAKVELITKAASDKVGTVTFYGLSEGGETSEGGSILSTHNSKFYTPAKKGDLKVATFPLADLIADKAKSYSHIVLKLDVEGAEYAILPHLLKTGAIRKLRRMYLEFHADYVAEDVRPQRLAEEATLLKQIRRAGVPCTLWI